MSDVFFENKTTKVRTTKQKKATMKQVFLKQCQNIELYCLNLQREMTSKICNLNNNSFSSIWIIQFHLGIYLIFFLTKQMIFSFGLRYSLTSSYGVHFVFKIACFVCVDSDTFQISNKILYVQLVNYKVFDFLNTHYFKTPLNSFICANILFWSQAEGLKTLFQTIYRAIRV